MIEQVYFSKSVEHFKEGFMKRWGLVEYQDSWEPALFVGFYTAEDIGTVMSHHGFKLLLFGGADIARAPVLSGLPVAVSRFTWETTLLKKYFTPKNFVCPPWKDYSAFKPVELGDMVYCYVGHDNQGCRVKYDFDMAERISKYYRVIFGYQGMEMDYVKEEYYARAFVNLQLNPQAGFTTAMEMAHMGRRSVSNHAAPFCIPYKRDVLDIVEIIDREAKKIGTVPGNEEAVAFAGISRDWLNEGFY